MRARGPELAGAAVVRPRDAEWPGRHADAGKGIRRWPSRSFAVGTLVALSAALLLILPALPPFGIAQADHKAGKNRVVTVLNYNLYQGTELGEVVSAPNLTAFLRAVAVDYGHAVANNFTQRAAAIAAEVGSADPDILTLQEVALWRTQFPSNPFAHATTVSFDYLQILESALAAHGLNYTVEIVRTNMDVQGTGLFPFGLMDVRLTDRAAILVKSPDLEGDFSVVATQQQDFSSNTRISVLGNPVTILNGWASVDIDVRGETIRVITTHLDPFSPAVRLAQARQLLGGPVNTTLPVLLAGDFNSRNTTTSYAALIAAGLTDAWAARYPQAPGFTCCRTPPDVLGNTSSALAERLDLLLVTAGFQMISATLLGTSPSDQLASGLWPSDHAGLSGTLRLPTSGP